MQSKLVTELDTPLVWFGAGAVYAAWFWRNPNSKLFWFTTGMAAVHLASRTPWPDAKAWRARRKSKRREEMTLEPPPVALDQVLASVEALRNELAEHKAQQTALIVEPEFHDHTSAGTSEESYAFT